ncbi:tape measure domain-containing protein [Paenibacillus anaericanus]|uniref:tape measure protein n=1 Tax=Paenibacillus anaericanus TaxID=170367 RepID=UPI00278499FB|nr:tape measure protein [Paenibacillus anaericanus]MDQ0090186.1 tape measure domain-containing protein [Paenibacillus anaericanus]
MASASKTLKMFDGVGKSLQSITNTMNEAITNFSDVMSQNVKLLDSVTTAQNNFNSSVDQSGSKIGNMIKKITFKNFASTLKPAMALSDEYVNSFSSIDLINDKLQTTKQLHDKVFNSAQRSKGSYLDMAASIGKMGQSAEGAFKSNDELIGFHELAQKSLKISGVKPENQQGPMNQITSVMASGNLDSNGLSDMMDYAPMMVDALSNYTGKSKSELMDLASSGALSADTLKNSMFAASDEINGKFSQLPNTFGESFVGLKNSAIHSLDPLIAGINSLMNSEAVSSFINALEFSIGKVGVLFGWIAEGAKGFGTVIQSYWPMIAGILAAISVVLIEMGIRFAIMAYQQIPMLIIKLWGMLAPVLAQAAAWMLAHMPILLIALAIGMLITVLVYFGVSVEQVVGFVTGVFFALYANIYNIVAFLYNLFASFVEFLINIFIDPVYAIKKLFYDLAMTFGNYLYNMLRSAEDFVGGLINAFGKISRTFGLDIKVDNDSIHSLSNGLKSVLDKFEEPVSNKNVVSIKRMEYKNLSESFDSGNAAGTKFVSSAMDKFKGGLNTMTVEQEQGPKFNPDPYESNGFNSISGNTNPISKISNVGKVDQVGKIDDTVDISSEDLKMMRELAEMKSIQNFVSLTPTVTVNTGPVSKEADVNEIMSRIEQSLEESISAHAAGVYA